MNVEQVGDVLVIKLPSRLDAVGVAAIENKISEITTNHCSSGKGKALADMNGVDFVASLALRMLLTNLKSVQALGGDLRLCGLQPQISEIFRKSRFDTLFKIYDTCEAAIADYTAE